MFISVHRPCGPFSNLLFEDFERFWYKSFRMQIDPSPHVPDAGVGELASGQAAGLHLNQAAAVAGGPDDLIVGRLPHQGGAML